MITPTGQNTPPLYTSHAHESPPSGRKELEYTTEIIELPRPLDDTVEISDKARALYKALKLDGKLELKWELVSPEEEAKGGAYFEDPDGVWRWKNAKETYKEKGLAGVVESSLDKHSAELLKGSLEYLIPEKKDLKLLINKIGKEAGISQQDINKMKIEVNSKGEIVVGGLNDKNKLKKMQRALNNEKGLGKRFKQYQNAEMIFLSQTSYRKAPADVTAFQDDEGGYIDQFDLEKRCKELGGDVDKLEGFNDPMVYAVAELYRDQTASADFSYGVKGVANPEGALERWAGKTKLKLKNEIKDYNDLNQNAGIDGTASLDNVSFKLTQNGGVEVIGTFSEDKAIDNEIRARIEALLREEMAQTDAEGRESIFETAITGMIMAHDSAFGETDLGKEAVVEFGIGGVKAYVDAPERKKELEEEIASTTATFVNSTLGKTTVSADDFTMNDTGKIVLAENMDPEKKAIVSAVLAQLEEMLSPTDDTGENEDSSPTQQSAKELATMLDEYKSYGPNAKNSSYLDSRTVEEETILMANTYNNFSWRYDYQYASKYKEYERVGYMNFHNYTYEPQGDEIF